ncbi:hypothetical protein Tco_1336192 [Tanacetum coccineum]
MVTNRTFSKAEMSPKSYTWGQRKEAYGGFLPQVSNKCHLHHNGPCPPRCHKCNIDSTLLAMQRHFKRDCPKLKNKNGGNGNTTKDAVLSVGMQKKGKCTEKPCAKCTSLVTFLLNNHYASILYDTVLKKYYYIHCIIP